MKKSNLAIIDIDCLVVFESKIKDKVGNIRWHGALVQQFAIRMTA
jgi:hypothetical protein